MSFDFFEDDAKSSSQLPFINEWISDGGEIGSIHDIQSVSPNKKNTGLMVRTNQFALFIWANSQTAARLKGFIQQSQAGLVPVPVVKVTSKDPYYVLGNDNSRQCFFSLILDELAGTAIGFTTGPIEPSSDPTPPTPTNKGTKRGQPAEK